MKELQTRNNNNNNANICTARLKQNSSGALMAQTNTVFSFHTFAIGVFIINSPFYERIFLTCP